MRYYRKFLLNDDIYFAIDPVTFVIIIEFRSYHFYLGSSG